MPPRSRRKDTDTVTPTDTIVSATVAQLTFARLYVANGGNALAAYQEAYGPHSSLESTQRGEASRVRNNPIVAKMINDALLTREKVNGIDRTFVLSRLYQVADHALAAGDYQATNRSLELLGKATGVFDTRADEQALGILDAIRKLSQSQGNVTVEAGYRELPPHREATEAGNGRQGQLRVTGDR